MFILISVWLRTLCPTHSRLSPRSLTYVPLSLGLNFVHQELKTLTWGEKSVGYKHTGLSLEPRADSALTTASHCWGEAAQSLHSPRWQVDADGFGVEFGSSWSYLPAQPMPLWTMDAPWEQWDCSCSKRSPGKLKEMLSQQTATVTELGSGEDKSHRGLEGEVQSSSSALLSHN